VQYRESLVVRVKLGPRRQDVPVPAADPGYLILLTKANAERIINERTNWYQYTQIINSTREKEDCKDR